MEKKSPFSEEMETVELQNAQRQEQELSLAKLNHKQEIESILLKHTHENSKFEREHPSAKGLEPFTDELEMTELQNVQRQEHELSFFKLKHKQEIELIQLRHKQEKKNFEKYKKQKTEEQRYEPRYPVGEPMEVFPGHFHHYWETEGTQVLPPPPPLYFTGPLATQEPLSGSSFVRAMDTTGASTTPEAAETARLEADKRW